jgi:hypothetical protein
MLVDRDAIWVAMRSVTFPVAQRSQPADSRAAVLPDVCRKPMRGRFAGGAGGAALRRSSRRRR